jgi:hypothetical protein
MPVIRIIPRIVTISPRQKSSMTMAVKDDIELCLIVGHKISDFATKFIYHWP